MAKGINFTVHQSGELRTVLSALFAGYDGKAAELETGSLRGRTESRPGGFLMP
jgi:hypothetical protein